MLKNGVTAGAFFAGDEPLDCYEPLSGTWINLSQPFAVALVRRRLRLVGDLKAIIESIGYSNFYHDYQLLFTLNDATIRPMASHNTGQNGETVDADIDAAGRGIVKGSGGSSRFLIMASK
jgi:hypothetical protein